MENDNAKLKEIKEFGFEVISNPRKHRSGGGIAIIYKNDLKIKCNNNLTKYKCFQVMECTMNSEEGLIRLVNVYRPPYSQKARFTEAHFMKEFEDYLKCLDEKEGKNIIVGDFNVHMETPEMTYPRQLNNLIRQYSYQQKVPLIPTHIDGGTIDLMIMDEDLGHLLGSMEVFEDGTRSDHYLVLCSMNIKTSSAHSVVNNVMEYRDFKNIDIEAFKADIIESEITGDFSSLEEAVDTYNNTLKCIMDKHCPVIKKRIKKNSTPWMDDQLLDLRRRKRAAERKFRKPGSAAEDKADYIKLRKQFNGLCFIKKKIYHQSSLKASSGDVKALYKKLDKLLGNEQTKLPQHQNAKALAESFKTYFSSKIGKIRSEIQKERKDISDASDINRNTDKYNTNYSPAKDEGLKEFEDVSLDGLKNLVSKLSNKFCCLDPIPTFLLKACIDELAPALLYIVNESLKTGSFPETMKNAVVKPTLKKSGCDQDVLSNYRPVSNLSTVSKLLERAVLQQLNAHLDNNNLYCSAQSGYRQHHSCETLLIRMADDLLKKIVDNETVLVVLLDLSAAFDTIDHVILLDKLKKDYKISGIPLKWLASYLKGRSFAVRIMSSMSGLEDLLFGVPQGSILGPILFILYTKELQSIAMKYDLEIQLYADDSQVYTGFNSKHPTSLDDTRRRINSCMQEIKDWMMTNFMKLNTDKTELLVCAKTKILESDAEDITIEVGNDVISECDWKADSGKSLGVMLDKHVTMDRQISSVVKKCNWTLLNLRRIAYCLNENLKIMLVKQLVLSKVDYCNALYMNLPDTRVRRLKSVMNSCIRFIYHINDRNVDLLPYYRRAHILPFHQRVRFKACLIAHKAVYGNAPQYIQELVTMDKPCYPTRLKDGGMQLVESLTKTNLESRRFSAYAPEIWNRLPVNIRNEESVDLFKRLLKTHLFSLL